MPTLRQLLIAALLPPVVAAASTVQGLDQIPITELTVFKDGHAFVLHEGSVQADERGRVTIGQLPNPVMGTFWSSVQDDAASLRGVVAGQSTITSSGHTRTLGELVAANIGKSITLVQADETVSGVLVDIPALQDRARGATLQSTDVLLIQMEEGFQAVPFGSVREVVFQEAPNTARQTSHEEATLTMQIENADRVGFQPRVAMAYLQKGFRWIPQYHLELLPENKVRLTLQAALLNELHDIEDATLHLVVGVPSFYFKDTLDPIALDQNLESLSQYFQSGSTANVSNMIRTQQVRMREVAPRGSRTAEDAALASGDSDNLYVFELKGITLARGERMLATVLTCEMPYKDLYQLHLGIRPPHDLQQNMNDQQRREIASLLSSPKADHKLRLTNTGGHPLTTAPLTITRNGQLLAQALMTYTPPGETVDVMLTQAVNIGVQLESEEVLRVPEARRWGSRSYDRIELHGAIVLSNALGQSVQIDVRRELLGKVDEVLADGTSEALNMADYGWRASFPYWWRWAQWPNGTLGINGISRIEWDVTLQPGQRIHLPYRWHYLWRTP